MLRLSGWVTPKHTKAPSELTNEAVCCIELAATYSPTQGQYHQR